MSVRVISGSSPEQMADAIRESFDAKARVAREAFREFAGQPYCPSSGTEGDYFQADWCETCDHWRATYERDGTYAGFDDCIVEVELGTSIVVASMAYETTDPKFPKQWRYDDEGVPECTAWVKRTPLADVVPPERPTLCGGARTPAEERAAYDRAMQVTE